MKKSLLLCFLLTIFSALRAQEPDISQTDLNRLFVNDKIDISNLYPNPAIQYAVFDYIIYAEDTKATITFRNVLGSEIANYTLAQLESSIIIPLDKFPSGVYFFTLSVDDKKITTKKFLVKK